MSEMIRRVARAIKAEDMIRSREEDGEEPLSANELSAFLDHPNGSGLTDTWLTEIYRRRARAAIEAMREPTEQMLSVEKPMCHLGDGPPNYTGGHNWLLKADKQMWQAMIDAALTGDT